MNVGKIGIWVLLAICSFTASTVFAESSVWQISKGENYFYLGATVHLLTEDDYPLPEEFSRAYRDADELFFETDLMAAQTPAFQSRLLAAMMYSDERTLASELKPEIYHKLENFMKSRQMPIANFSKFQPWGVSLIITVMEYQRLGMTPEYGVDNYFNSLALTENKKIMSLESPEEQLAFLTSMTEVDPDVGIEYTLRDLDRLPEFIDQMKKSWRSGNLEEFSTSAFIMQMQTEFPKIYDTIVTNRNKTWMKQLATLTDDSDKEFVLVGAMHLSGEEGLLNQLMTQGFTVEQLED